MSLPSDPEEHTDDAEVASRDRMSDFEALMWEVERNPMLSNAFANLTILDRPPDRARFVARMRRAAQRVPRLRQRAVPAPGRLATPEWVDDPDFDLDHHLRWVLLGGEATDEELYDLVATFIRVPFDRGRPLWEFVVIEGLQGGRAAMLQRMHHTITDGEGGIKLSLEFLDFERSPDGRSTHTGGDASDADPEIPEIPEIPDEAGSGGIGSTLSGATRALTDTVRLRSGQLLGAIGNLGSMALHPGDAATVARSAARQAMMPSRRSTLWTERSLRRWFGTTRLSLEDVKTASHSLGGSVNDFFVCGAAGGAGAYHELRGHEVEHLRLSMPISTRRSAGVSEQVGGNAFAPSQTLVPTAPMAPEQRFQLIHEALETTKSEPALGVIGSAASVMNLLPSAALVMAGERLTAGVDFVCSNVRAAPFDVYIAGALLEANYPVGPLAGTAFNLTTMSYRGWLFLGLVVDPVAVEDPGALLVDIEEAFAELFASAGVDSTVG
jgi:WS/DGAT/MGAT family acyltransferase